jgi:hypothetical protein
MREVVQVLHHLGEHWFARREQVAVEKLGASHFALIAMRSTAMLDGLHRHACAINRF